MWLVAGWGWGCGVGGGGGGIGGGGEGGVQGGLVALDRDHMVRPAPGQVAGVLALGVPRVGGDHRTGDLDAVQQGSEQGDSLVLAPTSSWPSTTPSA